VSQAIQRAVTAHTSNDCAYQSRTLQMDGISLRPSGRSLSSCTRCANRMGSSSERNCDARKRVPVDGFSPNCTICRRDTPEEELERHMTPILEDTNRLPESCYSATRGLAVMASWGVLPTLMVSISLSLRFHDMMAVVQGRNGLCRCVLAKVLWSMVVSPRPSCRTPPL